MVSKIDNAVMNCANFLLANTDKYINDIVFVKVGNSKMNAQFFHKLEESLNNYQSLEKTDSSFYGDALKSPKIHYSENGLEYPDTQLMVRKYKKVILIVEEFVAKNDQLLKSQKIVRQLSSDVIGVIYVS